MPLQIIVAFTMLYMEVQYAFLAGLGVLILLIPCECHTISLITPLYSSTYILITIILVKDMTITLFRIKIVFCGIDSVTEFYGVSYGIFFTFNLNDEVFRRILSVLQNINLDLNNVITQNLRLKT